MLARCSIIGNACCAELQEVSPRPGRTTVALGLRACLGRSDFSHVGDDGFDASSPVATLGPAPRYGVGGGEQHFARGSAVFVPQGVPAARRADEFDELLVIPAQQGVVLLEDEHRMALLGGVMDEGI